MKGIVVLWRLVCIYRGYSNLYEGLKGMVVFMEVRLVFIEFSPLRTALESKNLMLPPSVFVQISFHYTIHSQ